MLALTSEKEPAMPEVQFFLFGKFTVLCDQQLLTCFQTQKVQELLCYLLLHRDRPYNRELLAETIWNEAVTPCTRKYLRKTLWQLQTALDSLRYPSTDRFLWVDPQWIQLTSNGKFSLDVAILDETFASIQGKRGKELNCQEFEYVQRAVQLYKGDLLEGWFQDWCVYERERFREIFLVMVEKLMGYCEVNNEYELGIEFGKIILGYDRARESTYQRIMKLYYRAGDRTSALRQFESCKNSLKEELGVEPSHRTLGLFNQIVNDEPQAGQMAILQFNDLQRNLLSERINERLQRIEGLVGAQSIIQEQIKNEIREIEHELNGTGLERR
jgi:DNA-binding SARP family transcriptional activator